MENYYMGIDVSKGYADFVILDSHKKVVKDNFQLDDTFNGHGLLYDILSGFLSDHPGDRVYSAVESTGGYENNWYSRLLTFQSTLNVQTARLNPLGVSANAKADLKRTITDRISAKSIAEYMISHPEKIIYQQEDPMSDLKKQWCFIQMLTKQSTQLVNQLQSLLYSANTEVVQYCRHTISAWVLKLLLRYPTAKKLSRAKVTSVAKIPYISHDRAEELVINAKKSIASATSEAMSQLITATVRQIRSLQDTIDSQTKIMAKKCEIPEVELLKTFPGISDHSAIGLMIEIQTVHRFPSVKKLASFFGLHPAYKTSGDGSSGFSMSKKGRKQPRQILFMVTLNAISSNPLIRDIYQQHTEKGMNKMAAIGLCMHKILRIIYGMLKHNEAFNPKTDRKNREKITSGTKKIRKDKTRRYQDFDSKAPVSKRQSRKRKQQSLSHSDNNTKDGISDPVADVP